MVKIPVRRASLAVEVVRLRTGQAGDGPTPINVAAHTEQSSRIVPESVRIATDTASYAVSFPGDPRSSAMIARRVSGDIGAFPTSSVSGGKGENNTHPPCTPEECHVGITGRGTAIDVPQGDESCPLPAPSRTHIPPRRPAYEEQLTPRDLLAIQRGIARCGVDGRSGLCAVYSSVS